MVVPIIDVELVPSAVLLVVTVKKLAVVVLLGTVVEVVGASVPLLELCDVAEDMPEFFVGVTVPVLDDEIVDFEVEVELVEALEVLDCLDVVEEALLVF